MYNWERRCLLGEAFTLSKYIKKEGDGKTFKANVISYQE